MQQGKLQPTSIYSPDPAMLFSGVVATSTGISATDVEVLAAGITALGGQWRTALTRDITHVFAVPGVGVASDDDACVSEPNTSKYHMAKHAQVQELSMKILLPHWFDDAVRLGSGSLPTEEYEWPEPKILKPPHTKGQSPSSDAWSLLTSPRYGTADHEGHEEDGADSSVETRPDPLAALDARCLYTHAKTL